MKRVPRVGGVMRELASLGVMDDKVGAAQDNAMLQWINDVERRVDLIERALASIHEVLSAAKEALDSTHHAPSARTRFVEASSQQAAVLPPARKKQAAPVQPRVEESVFSSDVVVGSNRLPVGVPSDYDSEIDALYSTPLSHESALKIAMSQPQELG